MPTLLHPKAEKRGLSAGERARYKVEAEIEAWEKELIELVGEERVTKWFEALAPGDPFYYPLKEWVEAERKRLKCPHPADRLRASTQEHLVEGDLMGETTYFCLDCNRELTEAELPASPE